MFQKIAFIAITIICYQYYFKLTVKISSKKLFRKNDDRNEKTNSSYICGLPKLTEELHRW